MECLESVPLMASHNLSNVKIDAYMCTYAPMKICTLTCVHAYIGSYMGQAERGLVRHTHFDYLVLILTSYFTRKGILENYENK